MVRGIVRILAVRTASFAYCIAAYSYIAIFKAHVAIAMRYIANVESDNAQTDYHPKCLHR